MLATLASLALAAAPLPTVPAVRARATASVTILSAVELRGGRVEARHQRRAVQASDGTRLVALEFE